MRRKRFNIVPETKAINNALANRNSQQIYKFLELFDNILGKAKEYKGKDNKIIVKIEKTSNGFVHIMIEDNVGGAESISNCILKMKIKESESFENQYSIGEKESLIGLTIDGGSWKIFSRTIDLIEKHSYIYVEGPYDFEGDEYTVDEDDKAWPGRLKEPGTIVDMCISGEVINSFILDLKRRLGITKRKRIFKVVKGKAGNIDEFVSLLEECLGYYYAESIMDNMIQIIIDYKGADKTIRPINQINWYDKYGKWEMKKNLSRGTVDVSIEVGLIKASDNKLFYTCNRETAGLEIIINGRKYGCGQWIWEQQRESHHNAFLCRVNIISNSKNSLPKPNMDKSGLIETDECFLELIELILAYVPKPYRDDMDKKQIEDAKREKLIQVLREENGNRIQIIKEYEVGKGYNIIGNKAVDIRTCLDGKVSFYELKSGGMTKDIFKQMLTYIVLAVSENEKIDTFILVAESYSDELAYDLKHIGEVMGVEVICKKWRDYNIVTEQIVIIKNNE